MNYADFYIKFTNYIPKIDLDTWSNFEQEYSNFNFEEIIEKNIDSFTPYTDDDWHDSCNHEFSQNVDLDLKGFLNKLKTYFLEWICSLTTKQHPICNIKKLFEEDSIEFINFNYTDTLESIYNVPSSNIKYIHGKANNLNSKIILGHNGIKTDQNKWFSKEQFDHRIIEGFFEMIEIINSEQKNTQKIFKESSTFWASLKYIKNIYVLGHSLSPVDLPYFEKIYNITKDNSPNWCISKYGNNERRELCDEIQKAKNFTTLYRNNSDIEIFDRFPRVKFDILDEICTYK
jgi:hypothetical protein